MNAITALLLAAIVRQGWGRDIFRVSPDPVIAFEGSDVLFQWNLRENLTTQPDFKELVFGIWRNGYLATYFTTVKRNEQVIPNPDLKDEAPQIAGRVQWRGDLSKSLVVFQISTVSSKDQMNYGLLLNFGPYGNSLSDSVSLKVEEMRTMITALPLLLKPTTQSKNISFHCDFHVDEDDESLFDGVAVGVWERGGISLTLMTVTSHYNIVINPRLYQEGPEYSQRVYGYLSTYNINNSSRLTVELADMTESGDRPYGCSMYFGPFREPLGSSLSIDVKDSANNNGLPLKTNHTHETSKVRVGKEICLSCPVLTEVIELDGTFKTLFWSYCTSKTCTSDDTTWSWMAGMNRQRITKVTHKDPYKDRLNLTSNGTLVLSNVRISDSTVYRCTVQRVNFTSPRYYFVTLVVNATAPPRITKRSKEKVTVIEGNPLFLVCEAEGFPVPIITWTKNGKLLLASHNKTKFIIHETSKEDGGKYKCEASNTAGRASYTCTVEVTGEGHDGKKWTTGEIVSLTVGLVAVVVIVTVCLCKIRKNQSPYNNYENV